jgi:hypothetical protein
VAEARWWEDSNSLFAARIKQLETAGRSENVDESQRTGVLTAGAIAQMSSLVPRPSSLVPRPSSLVPVLFPAPVLTPANCCTLSIGIAEASIEAEARRIRRRLHSATACWAMLGGPALLKTIATESAALPTALTRKVSSVASSLRVATSVSALHLPCRAINYRCFSFSVHCPRVVSRRSATCPTLRCQHR